MKKLIITIILGATFVSQSFAQTEGTPESYGRTFNVGLGVGGYSGYYRYVGHSLPVVNLNYEFNTAPNFTLAPFVSISTYQNSYYWGNVDYPYKYYYYKQTIIPIGVKGTYYFDHLLNAGTDWDFYAAASLGISIVHAKWENGYYGDRNYYQRASPLFIDIHVGAEYHISKRVGLFLDLSTGVSTVGLAVH